MKREGGLRLKGTRKESAPGKPLVSVVTVVYNGEKHLEQAIRSVLGQSYGNIETIIVDGGSTDGTLDILRRHEDRIDCWISEPDQGIYDAMNKGIGLASGALIGLLNSDDWYEAGALESVAAAFNEGNGGTTVFAGAWNLVFDDLGLTIRATPSLKFHAGMPLSHQAMFIPKEIYDSIGKYDVRYRYAADLDMALRLHANNIGFRFLESVLVNFRTTGASDRHFRESGREASDILRKYLPWRRYCLFRIIRFKTETLTFLSLETERLLGKPLAGFLKKTYFRLKAAYSREWRTNRSR